MANQSSTDTVGLTLDLEAQEFQRQAAEANAAMGKLAAAFGRGEVDAGEFDYELHRLATAGAAAAEGLKKAEQAARELAAAEDRAAARTAQEVAAELRAAAAAEKATDRKARAAELAAQAQQRAAERSAEAQQRAAEKAEAAQRRAADRAAQAQQRAYDRTAAAAQRSAEAQQRAAEKAGEAQARAADRAAAAQARLASASDRTQQKLGGLNQTIRGVGFGISDIFSNNGPLGQKVQGFANNVGGIMTGLFSLMGKTGPHALAAAAGLEILTTGVGALLTSFNIKSVSDFFDLFRSKSPFPKAAQDVDGMKRELERAKDAMEELEKRSSLTAEQLARYNSLRAETARLEKKVADEQQRQADIKKLNETAAPDVEKEHKEASESIVKGLGGEKGALGPDGDIARRAALALNTENDEARNRSDRRKFALDRRINEAPHGSQEQRDLIAESNAEARVGKAIPTSDSRRTEVADILRKAVLDGNLEAYRKLQGMIISRPDLFTDREKEAIQAASPERRAKAKEWEALVEWADDFLEEMEKEFKEAQKGAEKRADDLASGLEKQGKEAEAAAKKEAPEFFKPDAPLTRKERADAKAKAEEEAGVGKQLKDEDAGIKAGAYVERAEAEAARVRAQGGDFDQFGRFRRMDAAQQHEYLRRQAEAELARKNPKMDRQQRYDVSNVIASRATDNLDKRLSGLQQRGLDQHQATQAALAETQQVVSQLLQRLQAVEAGNRQLRANARQLANRAAPRSPSNLNQGVP